MHLEEMSGELKNALDRLAQKFPNISLKSIYDIEKLGRWNSEFKYLRVEHVQWELESWLKRFKPAILVLLV